MNQTLPQGPDDKKSHRNEERNSREDKAIVLRLERQMDKVLTEMDKALTLLKSSDEARQHAEDARQHAEEARQKESDAYKKLQSHGAWWKYGSFVIGILLGVGGMYYASRTIDIQAEAAQESDYNQRIAMVIKDDLTEKKNMLKNMNDTIRYLRIIDQEIIRRCIYKHPFSQEEQERLRWEARDKVIGSFVLSPYVFDENVHKIARDFINYESSFVDVCQYKPIDKFDDTLVDYEIKMNGMMGKLIDNDKNKLKELK